MRSLGVALFALLSFPAFSAPPPDAEARIIELMKLGHVPGVGLAVVDNGKIWTRTFGLADAKTGRPLEENAIFNAASLSKQIFTYAVLKLVDQGKLDLDAPLTHYVPKRIIENDPRLDLITARIVLAHRSGLPNGHGHEVLSIHFAPGTQFSYSADGIAYLQEAVEQITGKPLEQLAQELVFVPLKMKDSSYLWRADYDARAAAGHDSDGATIPIEKTKTRHASAVSSFSTTVGDYALFMQAVLAGEGLKPETLRAMETPQIAVNPDCANCIGMTPNGAPLPPEHPSKDVFWGLGWGIEQTPSGEILFQWGDNVVHRNFVALNLKTRLGVAMFTNSENGLSIAPAVFQELTGIEHPAFAWLKYDRFDSPTTRFLAAAHERGLDSATNQFDAQLKSSEISEGAINGLGYKLLPKDHAEAIRAFLLNTQLHPQSGNVYDSLAEAYMTDGQKELAIKNYQQSLALDPKNTNAVQMLAKLRQ